MQPTLVRWESFFQDSPLRELLTAAVAVSVGLFAANEISDVPDWLAIHPVLTAEAFMLAFLKVWNARSQGIMVAPTWDVFIPKMTDRERMVEVLVEFPYVFSLFVMLFASVLYQVFLGVLATLYAAYLVYAALLQRATTRLRRESARETAAGREPLLGPDEVVKADNARWFYHRRAILDSIGLVTSVVGLVAFTRTVEAGTDGSLLVATVITAILMLVEYPAFSWLRLCSPVGAMISIYATDSPGRGMCQAEDPATSDPGVDAPVVRDERIRGS